MYRKYAIEQLLYKYIKIIAIFFIFFMCIEAPASPKIIAHRCGAKELPENTVFALKVLEVAGVTYAEIDVQLTRDGIPVLHHPNDLLKIQLPGQVKDYYYEELTKAFWIDERFPAEKLVIPTLEEALAQFPEVHFIIDFKSTPHAPLVDAVLLMVNKYKAWDRLVFYSTNNLHLQILKKKMPQAVTFENRSDTRARLLNMIAARKCTASSAALWLGFEAVRKMRVTEDLQLGEQGNEIEMRLWTPEMMACTRQRAPHARIVWFGVNDLKTYENANKQNVDAVFTDIPLLLKQFY